MIFVAQFRLRGAAQNAAKPIVTKKDPASSKSQDIHIQYPLRQRCLIEIGKSCSVIRAVFQARYSAASALRIALSTLN
jgi:hypothetical protein